MAVGPRYDTTLRKNEYEHKAGERKSGMSAAPHLAAYAFGGSTMTVLLPGTETDGAFALVHIIKGPGSSTPRHMHDSETEISYVLEGDLALETPSGIAHLGVDEWHVLPPGGMHRLFNESSSAVHELLVCAPAIFDRFVATAGNPVAPFSAPEAMTDHARESISKHAPDFGIRLFRETPKEQLTSTRRVEPETLDALGGRFEVLAALSDQDDALVLLRFTLKPGQAMPPSAFADRHALFLVTGQLEMHRDCSGWQALTPRAAQNVAAGERYALSNTSGSAASILVVSTVRFVRLLRASGSAA